MLITNGQFLPVTYLPLNGAGATARVINVAYTASAVASADLAINEGDLVVLVASTKCYVRRQASGAAAAATTSDFPLPADQIAFFRINNGERLSAIRDAADGNLRITIVNVTGR